MSLLRYPGGKAKIKNIIIGRLVEQTGDSTRQYREPFFGGGGIGLELVKNNTSHAIVWINDRDPGIAALWTAVILYPDDLKERVLTFKPSVKVFYDFKSEVLKAVSVPADQNAVVDLGFKKLALHRISFSGLGSMAGGPLGGRNQNTDQKIDARWSPLRLCEQIEAIHAKFASLDVHSGGCTCLDFAAVIEDESCPALLYLDPPYVGVGNDLYQCGFTEADHVRLAGLLRNTPHSWVLSYDDCPLVRRLYSWAQIDRVVVGYSIRSVRRSSELLITRRSSDMSLTIALAS